MTEHLHSIREHLNAPNELVDAVAKGEPYRRREGSGDSKRRHVKRFTVAIAAYICVALLLVGTVMLLPTLFDDSPAPPVTKPTDTTTTAPIDDPPIPPDDFLSPEALYEQILTSEGIVYTNVEDDYTFVYSYDGTLFKCETYIDGVYRQITYYDPANQVEYYCSDPYGNNWSSYESDQYDWPRIIDSLDSALFEDDHYEKTSNGYIFTDEAIAEYCAAHGYDGIFEASLTYEDGVYTLATSLTGDSVQSDWQTLDHFSFAELNLRLPTEQSEPIIDGLAYTENEDGTYTVAGRGESLDASLVIPSTYNGKAVTAIAAGAFYNDMELYELTIPSSVKIIGNEAFQSCQQLAKLTIADGVEIISNGAFAECYSLEQVTIPGSVKKVGDDAFVCCSWLSSVTLEEGVESIGTSSFAVCYSLSRLNLPDSLQTIDSNAFEGCERLTQVTIPSGVTMLGTNAFKGCALTRMTFANPSGWIVNGVSSDLSDPASAAALFKGDGAWAEMLE